MPLGAATRSLTVVFGAAVRSRAGRTVRLRREARSGTVLFSTRRGVWSGASLQLADRQVSGEHRVPRITRQPCVGLGAPSRCRRPAPALPRSRDPVGRSSAPSPSQLRLELSDDGYQHRRCACIGFDLPYSVGDLLHHFIELDHHRPFFVPLLTNEHGAFSLDNHAPTEGDRDVQSVRRVLCGAGAGPEVDVGVGGMPVDLRHLVLGQLEAVERGNVVVKLRDAARADHQ